MFRSSPDLNECCGPDVPKDVFSKNFRWEDAETMGVLPRHYAHLFQMHPGLWQNFQVPHQS